MGMCKGATSPKHGSSDGSELDSRPRGPGFESRSIQLDWASNIDTIVCVYLWLVFTAFGMIVYISSYDKGLHTYSCYPITVNYAKVDQCWIQPYIRAHPRATKQGRAKFQSQHHRSFGPTTGRNPGGRWNQKKGVTSLMMMAKRSCRRYCFMTSIIIVIVIHSVPWGSNLPDACITSSSPSSSSGCNLKVTNVILKTFEDVFFWHFKKWLLKQGPCTFREDWYIQTFIDI